MEWERAGFYSFFGDESYTRFASGAPKPKTLRLSGPGAQPELCKKSMTVQKRSTGERPVGRSGAKLYLSFFCLLNKTLTGVSVVPVHGSTSDLLLAMCDAIQRKKSQTEQRTPEEAVRVRFSPAAAPTHSASESRVQLSVCLCRSTWTHFPSSSMHAMRAPDPGPCADAPTHEIRHTSTTLSAIIAQRHDKAG